MEIAAAMVDGKEEGMKGTISSTTCPKCKGTRLKRTERKKWMRYLSDSKYYSCKECGTRFLKVFGWLKIRTGSERAKPGGGTLSRGASSGNVEKAARILMQMDESELLTIKAGIEAMLREKREGSKEAGSTPDPESVK